MKKKMIGLFLLVGLLAASAVTASAQTMPEKTGKHVQFTKDKKVESNFKSQDITDELTNLQPGDDIYLTVSLENQYTENTDWYMKNDILESLEETAGTSASGGAYSYGLTYIDKDGNKTVLYDSDTVGGEGTSQAGTGLHSATSSLKDYFFLDTLAAGESGKVQLYVALDGETQGNAYQNTLAQLEMSFAVEVTDTATTSDGGSTRANVVKTGDRELPMGSIVLMGAAGIVLLCFGIRNYQINRKERKGAA